MYDTYSMLKCSTMTQEHNSEEGSHRNPSMHLLGQAFHLSSRLSPMATGLIGLASFKHSPRTGGVGAIARHVQSDHDHKHNDKHRLSKAL